MRGFEREATFACPAEELWALVSRLDFCRSLNRLRGPGAFFKTLRHELIRPQGSKGPDVDDETDPLAQGTQVRFLTKRGRQWIKWSVTDFRTPQVITYTAADTKAWTASYFMVVQLRLKDLGEGRTRLSVRFSLIMLNRLMEITTLVLPHRWLYSWLLSSIFRKLRKQLG